jgi:hypothetical protein
MVNEIFLKAEQCRMVARIFFRGTKILNEISGRTIIQNSKRRGCQVSRM